MSAIAGLSTLGVKLAYGLGTPDTKPTASALSYIERVNSIGGITLDTEKIDASALEDLVSRYVQGRQDTGGTWDVTFNLSDDVMTQLNSLISSYNGKTSSQVMWFEVIIPDMATACWVSAQVPANIPMPEMAQNELLTVVLSLTIEQYGGWVTKVLPASE